MCFNAAKSWQLGWYSDKAVTLDKTNEPSYVGVLGGIADYSVSDHTVLVKLDTGSSIDYYVNYNRRSGINSDTQEAGNQVTVVTQGGEGTGYGESELVAKLVAGATYTILNFDGSGKTATVTVDSIAPPDQTYAVVSICIGGCPTEQLSQSPTKSASPTPLPMTPGPSSHPSVSAAPSSSPTSSPSTRHSSLPSSRPSMSSARPSSDPTSEPSTGPSSSPSTLPSVSAAPSYRLTSSPSTQPSSLPSSKPSLSSAWPSSSPTSEPSTGPSSSPSASPSAVSAVPSSGPSSPCEDSQTWSWTTNNGQSTYDCTWVAEKPNGGRCGKVGTGDMDAREACPVACSTCPAA
jgi:hypothetical protein